MTTFNLVDAEWIPVIVDGRPAVLSLRDTLVRADQISGLGLADPLQTVALLRQVLLPTLFEACNLPRDEDDWAARWQAGRLGREAIEAYLHEHRDRFDLFHPVRPFAQVAGLRTAKDETKPVSLLLPAIATGNNVPLFSSRTEADPPELSPAEAARALLASHCWDTAAIKSGAVGDPQVKNGKTTGNPTGTVGQLGVRIPMSATLFETLMLNTPFVPQRLATVDRPQWRAEPAHTAAWRTRPALGLLDLLTWQSRRIRLIPEERGGLVVVRSAVVSAGDRLDHLPPDMELHTAWRQDRQPKAGRSPQFPVRHQPGRAAWRGMASLLATSQPTQKGESSSRLMAQIGGLRVDDLIPADLRLQVLCVGVAYGNQSAVVEDVMVDLLPLPVTALTDDSPVRELLLRIAEQAEQLREAANKLGDDLRRALGGDKQPWDKGLRLGDGLIHEYNTVVRRVLGGLQRDPGRTDAAEEAWLRRARRIAFEVVEPVLDAAPPQAFLGRQVSEKLAHRQALAEARFRRSVNDILGPAAQVPATSAGANA